MDTTSSCHEICKIKKQNTLLTFRRDIPFIKLIDIGLPAIYSQIVPKCCYPITIIREGRC